MQILLPDVPLPATYRRPRAPRCGRFLVIEGPAGSGKSTLARLLASHWGCPYLHTAPDPIRELQPFANTRLRPLPHLLFYLTAALHVSDTAREALTRGSVIVDRYFGSVVANHAAVHNLRPEETRSVVEPFLDYALRPDLTIYLHAPAEELAARTRSRPVERGSNRRPPLDSALISRLQSYFDHVAEEDPTAVHMSSERHTPDELVTAITTIFTDLPPPRL